jgi:hypothetical protein
VHIYYGVHLHTKGKKMTISDNNLIAIYFLNKKYVSSSTISLLTNFILFLFVRLPLDAEQELTAVNFNRQEKLVRQFKFSLIL